MDTKDKSELLSFRIEYENSGLTMAAFAKEKGMEYWKVCYALRKALRYHSNKAKPNVGFNRLVPKPDNTHSERKLLIRTSYGLEITIPL